MFWRAKKTTLFLAILFSRSEHQEATLCFVHMTTRGWIGRMLQVGCQCGDSIPSRSKPLQSCCWTLELWPLTCKKKTVGGSLWIFCNLFVALRRQTGWPVHVSTTGCIKRWVEFQNQQSIAWPVGSAKVGCKNTNKILALIFFLPLVLLTLFRSLCRLKPTGAKTD